MPKWLKILIGLLAIVIVIIIAFLVYMNTAFISKEEAKTNLANHISVDEEDIYFENVDLEMDNNQYEVDFYYNNQEYEAKIDAKEGKIIYTDYPLNSTNTTNNGNGNQNGSNNQNGNSTQQEITLEEAYERLKEPIIIDKEREEENSQKYEEIYEGYRKRAERNKEERNKEATNTRNKREVHRSGKYPRHDKSAAYRKKMYVPPEKRTQKRNQSKEGEKVVEKGSQLKEGEKAEEMQM